MMIVLFIAGMALPLVIGWCALRVLEEEHVVLSLQERWAYALLVGLTGTMFVTFLVHVLTGLPLTLIGFLSVQILCAAVLGAVCVLRGIALLPPPMQRATMMPCTLWKRGVVVLVCVWVALKIGIGAFALMHTPPAFHDTLKNWNMRAKLIVLEHALPLEMPFGEGKEMSSAYPPTVSMSKAWLALLANEWSEGLVNSVHLLWYVALLAIVYALLGKRGGVMAGALGVYGVSSLPLVHLHGVSAYADVFIAAHLCAGVSMLVQAAQEDHVHRRNAFLRIGALCTALLAFTKNEGMLLYVPILLLVIAMFHTRALVHYICAVMGVALPWMSYKWWNGLGAHSTTFTEFGFAPRVLPALFESMVMMGNWLLLFPLLVYVLVWKRQMLAHRHIALLVCILGLVLTAQLGLYLFTPLAHEALRMTGASRALVHIAPLLIVLLITLFVRFVPLQRANNSTFNHR